MHSACTAEEATTNQASKEDIMYPASRKSHSLTVRTLLSAGALVTALTLAIPASAQSTSTTAPKIKITQIRYVPPDSGKQMYEAYCAACHGVNGKGNVRAAAALSQPPTDLSLLSSSNGGKFPAYRVRYLLMDQNYHHDRAAGSMPVWAPAFKSLQQQHPELVTLRVRNLVAYLEAMQAPPAKAGTDQGSSANSK